MTSQLTNSTHEAGSSSRPVNDIHNDVTTPVGHGTVLITEPIVNVSLQHIIKRYIYLRLK